jgi:hypothetical protein
LKTVTIAKDALLMAVKDNYKEHCERYADAMVGFRKQAIKELTKMLTAAKSGKVIKEYIGLNAPREFKKEYERVLSMLTMSVHDEVEISDREFAQYVLDDWDWKEKFVGSTHVYNTAKWK